ncbi:HAMP domain-containing protein [Funiculus sociatus GB2-A5]|uniref:HAMP domain-containing protein n=1 Tax=Funiculus sociatus GB2-A5 TaxID=2933946 RepID=A0ABV0JLK2_9CYAN|nr:adenylate/guanylate cyclase domain-containing protein [Trichocoleus sp. FACHB-6]MBD2062738.1 HAMP domain-containing protein [Trichocoleus sp. FACHB-6]
MKVPAFRSIHTQIMTATTLLIVAIVSSMVWLWAKNESRLYRYQKRREVQQLTVALSNAWTNELQDQNWGQIRLGVNSLARRNQDFVYILISDVRLSNQIVAASHSDFQEQFFPDIIPVEITESALEVYDQTLVVETSLLRDISFNSKTRARRGEKIIETAAAIRDSAGQKIGTLRIGMSLRQVNQAVANAVEKAFLVGVFGLSFGLFGAYLLAKQLSNPVRRLQISAAKIAAGDLEHRAEIHRRDEIGALAIAFNEMSASLQTLFNRFEKTIESFYRFVPEKFLLVIAPEGIENIHVGFASTRIITILFADIRGYTAMSEQMTPLETFYFLNDYLACMGQVIDSTGGFIDKYIGDAIMALFDDEATDSALLAALAMRQRLKVFNEERSHQGLPTIDIGIGIHRGEVVMGTVGFSSRIDSTVIGDTVNVAARVESLTKNYDSSILLTQPVVTALRHPKTFPLRLVDKFVRVKGKEEPVAIYELDG